MTSFVDIVNELMKGWAKAAYGGDMSRLPGMGQLDSIRQVDMGGHVQFSVRMIDKITDLYLIHEAGKAHQNGDAGALLETVLRHVTQRWDPNDLTQSLIGDDGKAAVDVMLFMRDNMSDDARGMRTTTATRVCMVRDALADPAPFPDMEVTPERGNVTDNQMSAILDSGTTSASQVDSAKLMAVQEPKDNELQAQMAQLQADNAKLLQAIAGSDQRLNNFITPQSAEPVGSRLEPTRFVNDVKHRNLGNSSQAGAPHLPKTNLDGSIKMRLTDKPKIPYADVMDDAKSVLATRLNITNEGQWLTQGGQPCTLCKYPDHYLWHCVKVWAATNKGQEWLGTTKAAEFRAKLKSDGGLTFTVTEFLDYFDDEYCLSKQPDQLNLIEATLMICDYCDVDLQMPDDDAKELLAFAGHYRGCAIDNLFDNG
jgi:hypothetical protein